LPLKEADLKTFEAYKKAIRQDVTKISAGGKTKFWVYKDIELPLEKTPAKKQKVAAFIALVDDTGVRANPALKGKQVVCLGTCNLEEGKVAFEPLKGKVPYRLLKVSVPLFLGKPMYIPSTADAESDTDEGIEDADDPAVAKPSEAPPPPPMPGANLEPTWSQLLKDYQAAASANPARKGELDRAAAGIPDLIKANNVKEASARMATLRAMLDAPPPARPVAPPPPPPPMPGASLEPTWGQLLKDYQAAASANSARKGELDRAAAGIPDLIKANNVKDASARMATLRAMLDAPPARPLAPPPPPPMPGASLAASWNNLVKEYQAAVAANPARRDELAHAAAGIPDLLKANNVKEASARMATLRAMLDAPPAPPVVPPPPPPPMPGASLAATWNNLVKEYQAAIAANPARREPLARAAAGIPDLVKANDVKEASARMETLRAMLATPPAPPPGASLAATWNNLVKEYQAAVALNPARRDELARAAAGIPDLLKANNSAEAKKRMDVLAAMLAAGPAAKPDASALNIRWNALVKRIEAEEAAHPEKKAGIARARAGIPDMIKIGKLDLAAKLMDTVEQVLGQADPRAEQYRARYEAQEKELLEALKDPARDAGSLRAIGAFAQEKAGAGDYAAALQALDRLQAALGVKPNAADEAEIRRQWAAAKQTWLDCIETVDKQISQVKSRMVACGIPEFKALAERGLPALTENHKTPVMRALFELNGEPGQPRKSAAAKAQAAIAAFRGHIGSSHLMAALDEHAEAAFEVPMTLRTELEQGLSALERTARLFAAN
jgi:hypothetical protein